MRFELIWQPKGVIKRYFGLVTSSDLMGSLTVVGADARFDDLCYVISDFRECTGVLTSAIDIEENSAIANIGAKSHSHLRIAVVATTTETIALAQQYANSPFNRCPMRIFATLDEAKAWLGLS